jgi:hypothetical protein
MARPSPCVINVSSPPLSAAIGTSFVPLRTDTPARRVRKGTKDLQEDRGWATSRQLAHREGSIDHRLGDGAQVAERWLR